MDGGRVMAAGTGGEGGGEAGGKGREGLLNYAQLYIKAFKLMFWPIFTHPSKLYTSLF